MCRLSLKILFLKNWKKWKKKKKIEMKASSDGPYISWLKLTACLILCTHNYEYFQSVIKLEIP